MEKEKIIEKPPEIEKKPEEGKEKIRTVCSECKIMERTEDGNWVEIDTSKEDNRKISHSWCPECVDKLRAKAREELKKQGFETGNV